MSQVPALMLLALVGLAVTTLGGAGSAAETVRGDPEIVSIYANPIPPDDPGEYVTVEVPPGTNLGDYQLSDGENTVNITATTVSGRVRLTTNPAAVRNQSAEPGPPIVELQGSLSLSNGGERVVLRTNDSVVDSMRYGRVGEGEIWRDGRAVPRGRTSFEPMYHPSGEARGFVLPDGAGVPKAAVTRASERILLAGYTFSSWDIAAELAAAAARGTTVKVLVEGGPVGGVSRRSAAVLGWLASTEVTVRVLHGPTSRYRFHHAKYAVIDNRSLVTTENWEPGGLGGHGTRGWGLLVQQASVAADLADVFYSDWTWMAAQDWTTYESRNEFQPPSPATTDYPTRFPSRSVRTANISLLTAPDNVETALLGRLRRADASIRVVTPRIGNQTPLRQALISAARRDVDVKVLVSGSWYSEAENRALVRSLRTVARREGLPLAVRLAEPRSRYSHLHAKGVVIDGETVIVGSVNWNTVSTRENREVVLAVDSRDLAAFYIRVFRADWRGAAWRLPLTLGIAVLAVAVLTALLIQRAISFDVPPGDRHRDRQPPSSRPGGRELPPESRGRT